MRHMSIDIETFSSVSIQKSGMFKYAQSDDFEILLFAYSVDGSPVKVIDLTETGEQLPNDVVQLLFDNNTAKHAYNALFEWYCLSRFFGLDDASVVMWLQQWNCTMLHGMYCGYPSGLGAAGTALGLPEDRQKLKTGSALIRYFCVPCTPTQSNGQRTRNLPNHSPERWALFKEYNAQDVVTEMEIERRLSAFPVPEDVRRQWLVGTIINMRGVAVDLDMVNGAIECSREVTERLTLEAVKLSGLDNPNSVAQLTKWLNENTDEEVRTLRKDDVKDLLGGSTLPDTARRLLEIRQELGKTSVKKYGAIIDCACADNRIRGLLLFYGANRTGRWAGRLVQVHNLPRTYIGCLPLARELVKKQNTAGLQFLYGSVPDTLSQLIRTAFVPADGCCFVDADFSAIEARVISWLAGESWRLDVFRTHGKIYEASASQMFGVPLEKISKGNPEYALRAKGKVAELALGYAGGKPALINMGALRMGLAEDELPEIVNRWRGANKRICGLWYAVESAALETVKTGCKSAVGSIIFRREMHESTAQDFLTVQLPSGRKLFYAKPFLAQNRFGRESIGYWGNNQTTKKWQALETYGGKLVENITQAVARDCLSESIMRLEAAGYRVVFHIHDEVVVECPEKDTEALDNVINIMRAPIPWAAGLPLNADGWVGNFFKKE